MLFARSVAFSVGLAQMLRRESCPGAQDEVWALEGAGEIVHLVGAVAVADDPDAGHALLDRELDVLDREETLPVLVVEVVLQRHLDQFLLRGRKDRVEVDLELVTGGPASRRNVGVVIGRPVEPLVGERLDDAHRIGVALLVEQ